MKKLFLILACAIWGQMAYAMPIFLTQAEYDDLIERYTQQVNQTKLILDDPEQKADLKTQNLAFCQRLAAYHEIDRLSEENPTLERANLMKMIARMYLDRQVQSLASSGMTEKVFCASHQSKEVQQDENIHVNNTVDARK